jgi:uncharacterized repeat protein (TIGR01451 family)
VLKVLLSAGAACVVLAVAVVAGATPTSTAPPSSITGTPQVGSTLSVTPGTYIGTGGADVVVADVWQRCDDSAATTCVSAGAGGTSYVVVAADLGKYLRVSETASDGVDPPAGPIYTGTTAQIAAAPQAPQLTTAPEISGGNLNVGQSLTRTAGVWSGNPTPTVTVAWQRCNDQQGSSCQDVGSGAASYTLVAADVSKFMRVREAATNGVQPDGHADSNVLGPVTQPLAPANPPVIDNTAPLVGQTVTVTGTGTWTGFPQPTGFSYAWQRCNDATGGGCVAIGANANAYVVVAADAGKWIRVQLSATNGTTQAQSVWVQTAQVRQAPVNTAAPGLTPSNANLIFATTGSALTLAADTGTWTATPAVSSFAYEWQRCSSADTATCAAIGGTTATPYTVQQADVGAFLRVKVTATNGVGSPGVAFSALSSAGTPPTPAQIRQAPFQSGADPMKPTIVEPNDGIPNRGETLTGSAGVWFAFPAPTLTPQWQRCSPTGTNCLPIDPQPPLAPAVTTGPEPYRHTNGANSWRYVVTDADLGSTLKLVVLANNGLTPAPGVRGESLPTQPARGGPLNLAGTPNGLPALTGTPVRGQTMTASSGLWSGFPGTQPPLAITHQWQRCPADGTLTGCVPVSADPPLNVPLSPAGATTCSSLAPCGGSSQYVPNDADLGKRLRVVVTVSNAVATVQVATALTDVVVGSPIIPLVDGSPDPAAQPKVTGTATQGLTLSASTGSWSAFPTDTLTYRYQWLRCSGGTLDSCSAVSGATTGFYLVGAADVGSQLRVRVTAANGVLPDGIAASEPTAKVTGSGGGGGPGADLIVQLSTSTSGSKVTYILRVGNIGSSDADGVTLTAAIPDALQVVSATSARGTCSGRVTCAIGQVKKGEFVTVTIAVSSTQSGTFTFTATVTSTTPDVNPSNNSVSTGSRLTTIGAAPTSPEATVVGVTGPTSTQLTVPLSGVSLRARRVGPTWVAETTFSLYSGKASLKLVATQNGNTKPLTLLKGSRLGTATTKVSTTQITLAAGKSDTFPVKVVLPAQGFSPRAVYVIRITATAGAASSTLNIGFKGVALLTRTTTAKALGKTWLVSSALALPTGRGTAVRAWVTPSPGTQKLPLLKGSRLGGAVVSSTRTILTTAATRAGALPVRIVLAAGGLSSKKAYVLRAEAKSADGLWTDYEIRFKGKPGKGTARALTGARATP